MNREIRRVGMVVVALFVALFLQLSYLQVVAAHRLATHPGNIRPVLRDYSRPRGRIVTADDEIVAQSTPVDDQFKVQRAYPLGTLFGHVSGFFSFTVGLTGIERAYNDDLSGRSRDLQPRNLRDTLIGKEHTGTVVLTLRAAAQRLAQKALGGRRGSVVVLEPTTGAVLALYSEPSFDPTPLASHHQHDVQQAFSALNADPIQPLLARSYRERYPPGSTFKVVTTSTAVEQKVATPDTTFPFLTELPLPLTDKPIHNFGGHRCGGTLTQSFTVSCNTTFAALGLQLGDSLVDGIHAFGVGERVPFDLGAALSAGPTPGTFKRSKPLFADAAIGQGDVAVTPLQMALVAAAIANSGVIMTPQVVHEVRDIDGTPVRTNEPHPWRRAVSPATADAVRSMMIDVVKSGTGTLAQITGVTVAGKTGTAQAPGGPPHAWFIGFAPAENPQFVVAVIVERGGNLGDEATGGRVAAPVARQVLAGLLGKPS